MATIFQSHLASLLIKYAAQGGIYLEELGAMPMVLPPVDEQDAIIAFLNQYCSRYKESSTKIIKVRDRLQEYRSALITNAVTGNYLVDVPNRLELNKCATWRYIAAVNPPRKSKSRLR
jgi:hypothetical protein